MDDKQIIALFEARATEAIEETDRQYGSLCRSLASKLLQDPSDVQECINDTYLALWNSIPPAKPSPLSAYVAKTVRNQALKKLEQLQRKKRNAEAILSFEELGDCIPAPSGPEELLEEKELRRAIVAFLQTRRSISRILFLRRYFFFDSVKEIAQAYGLSESKVKSSLMRTRNQLKLYLIKEGYDL